MTDLIAYMVGVPIAVIGLFILVAADGTPRSIAGAALLIAGSTLVSTAMLIGVLTRR
ncbi:hypothetical protein [Curtobacterium pusillum]|uniref:hypothetical protein n=1 Tax=Curtobacterium pusillum TaxID=69373 RepID=UPI001642AEC5|nr:hypothetical protein [Curtobacterium pusillum]